MPTRRAFLAAMIPAVAVFGMFWRWLDFEELEALCVHADPDRAIAVFRLKITFPGIRRFEDMPVGVDHC